MSPVYRRWCEKHQCDFTLGRKIGSGSLFRCAACVQEAHDQVERLQLAEPKPWGNHRRKQITPMAVFMPVKD